MARLTIASICPRMVTADTEANMATLHHWASAAAEAGADLALSPEAFVPGYVGDAVDEATCEVKTRFLESAEPVPGPLTARLAAWSRQLGIHLCTGMLKQAQTHRYNTQVLVTPNGECFGHYRKIQVAAREAWFSQPGNDCPVFDVAGIPIGILICRDKSFPEIARMLALNGAFVLLNPHSTLESSSHPFRDWSLKLCTARAMENGCYIIVNNNVVASEAVQSRQQAGYSFAIDPWGKTIHCDDGPGDIPGMALIEVDTAVVEARRASEGVHFNLWSRQPRAYGRLVDPDPSFQPPATDG